MKLTKILLFSFISLNALACTGLQLKAQDNSYVNGRTVEFGIPLDISGVVIPRNYEFEGSLPDGSAGLKYKSKYAAVGGGMFGSTNIADGVNEKGLAIGDFYFQGYATYTPVTAANKNHALSPTDFSNWIITQFASVDEVKKALNSVVIVATTPKGWPLLPPFHYVVYDKSGKSIVIEPINGKLKVYDNPIGVMTNSPTFDWQMTNLSNYINLSPENVENKTILGYQIPNFGQGSGLLGLPGDFTSPSRFVRAAFFSASAVPSATSDQAVLQAFHILNQFDIPVGAVRQMTNGQSSDDQTIVTTVKDPTHLKYYFKSYDDQSIKMVDLTQFDLNAKTIKTFAMKSPQPILDVSNTAK